MRKTQGLKNRSSLKLARARSFVVATMAVVVTTGFSLTGLIPGVGGLRPLPAGADGGGFASLYTHTPPQDSSQDLSPNGGGLFSQVMTNTTVYLDFWLPNGQHYESNLAGDARYIDLITRFVQDIGASGFHDLVTQYYEGLGPIVGPPPFKTPISNSVSYGGMWLDTTPYFPRTGAVGNELADIDIVDSAQRAIQANHWTEGLNHIVMVFTANGINECSQGGFVPAFESGCTDQSGGICANHSAYEDQSTGNTVVYAFMGFDNMKRPGNCDANAPYPNGDASADSEISTMSHELIEAETDPTEDGWTQPFGNHQEIGDLCNGNYAPTNDIGADVYLNGDPYIVQQEWSNAANTCAMDRAGGSPACVSYSAVCAPNTFLTISVDNPSPAAGSTINYTITLDNTSDTAAETNLTLNDTMPPGYLITNVSAPSSAAHKNNTANSLSVDWGTLAVRQSTTVTVTATVSNQSGAQSNCATLSGEDLIGTSMPLQTTNPCATTTVDADLAIANAANEVVAYATSPAGAGVTYQLPTVSDPDDPTAPAPICDFPSGSTFPIGTTTVTCIAIDPDDSNSPVSTSFTVLVNDSDLSIATQPNITVDATGPSGAVVIYPIPAVTDEDSPLPSPVCNVPSGSTFPIGTTTVTCSVSVAGDSNSPQTSFTVTVRDNDLALTNMPGDQTVNATSPLGAAVSYIPPTAIDEDSPLPPVNCSPSSGSAFPIGTTTVKCTVSAAGDSNSPVSGTFSVTVLGPAAQVANLEPTVVGVGLGTSLSDKLAQVESDLAAMDATDACGTLKAFLKEVNAQAGKQIPLPMAITLLASAARIRSVLSC